MIEWVEICGKENINKLKVKKINIENNNQLNRGDKQDVTFNNNKIMLFLNVDARPLVYNHMCTTLSRRA